MVMPYYEGVTLEEKLIQIGQPPSEQWLKELLGNILDALSILHGAQTIHRDIAPDNILIRQNGQPLLLDFGAARQIISERTQQLTAIFKSGYAPMEHTPARQTRVRGHGRISTHSRASCIAPL